MWWWKELWFEWNAAENSEDFITMLNYVYCITFVLSLLYYDDGSKWISSNISQLIKWKYINGNIFSNSMETTANSMRKNFFNIKKLIKIYSLSGSKMAKILVNNSSIANRILYLLQLKISKFIFIIINLNEQSDKQKASSMKPWIFSTQPEAFGNLWCDDANREILFATTSIFHQFSVCFSSCSMIWYSTAE